MRRTIFLRMLVAAIATGLVGATGATFASWLLRHRALAHRLADILRMQYDEDAARRCGSDPHWQLLVSPDARVYGYDETTLRSRNPEAPPLRMDLYAQLPPTDDRVALGFQHGHLGVAIVLRRRAAAPCGLIQLSSEPAVRLGDLLTGEVLGAQVTGFACCFPRALVVGVPLARRIHRLRRVTARVVESP